MMFVHKILLAAVILSPLHLYAADGLWAKDIEALIEKNGVKKSQYGIEVKNSSGAQTYFSSNADQPFNPASTLKMLISTAALEKWGPQNKFSTFIKKDKKNLCLVGTGDPSLVYEDLFLMVEKLLRSPSFDENIANIVVDESFFPATRTYADDFEGDEQRSFTAPLSSLSLNYNSVTVFVSPGSAGFKPFVFTEPRSNYFVIRNEAKTTTTGEKTISIETSANKDNIEIIVRGKIPVGSQELIAYRAVSDPAIYAGTILKDLLVRNGATVSGTVEKKNCAANASTLVQFDSKPLSQIIMGMNKFSNNFIAEMLLIQFGSRPDSISGLENLNAWLESKNFPLQNVSVQNSSGLSRKNSVTANFLWSVLSYGKNQARISPELFSSLPIGGLDGTLKRRFKTPALQGLVRAKSGSLRDAVSLVGSIQTQKQGELLFAFLFRLEGKSAYEIQQIEEKILERLAFLGSK